MHRRWVPFILVVGLVSGAAAPIFARTQVTGCGTYRERAQEALFLHRRSMRQRPALQAMASDASRRAVNRDVGNIAIIEDSEGVVARQNQFNLEGRTVRFTPSTAEAVRYRFAVSTGGYDDAAAAAGTPLESMADDDSRSVALPFTFPFFGASYKSVFVNSDGNLTFGTGDTLLTERSLGRVTSGPPRIAALFDDLDPSKAPGSMRVLAEAGRVVVSWVSTPEYQTAGIGLRQTFQARLYPDGRIELSYLSISATQAVVGIAPGRLKGSTSIVSFRFDSSLDYSAAVLERFGDTASVDIVRVAQKFYETHEDAYDYLVIYNNMGLLPTSTAVAYEVTVRNNRSGYGDPKFDYGEEFGSSSRLQAVLNLGHLNEYPTSPTAPVMLRYEQGDTPLSIIGHEAGHLFLAYASVRNPGDADARPMLGAQGAHWSFTFNSEASLVEGERIQDRGAGVKPRFLTTGITEAYSPLDQYLMGFRSAEEVHPPALFLVTGVADSLAQRHPAKGVTFDGSRRDITVEEIIAAEGRRTPDHTVTQRRFRFAFILVVAAGSTPSAEDLAKVEGFRTAFEPYYTKAASNRATADTTLKRSMKLSLFPAAGVLQGATATGSITLEAPPKTPLIVSLDTQNGNASFPRSVTIGPDTRTATFTFTGLRAGVEELTATPADTAYETAFARVQVAAASAVKLTAVSGESQVPGAAGTMADPIVVRVTDINDLPYPGARVLATVTSGGAVSPAAAATDHNGQASFRWTPGTGGVNRLQLAVEGAPSATLSLTAGRSVVAITSVASAASTTLPGMAPASLATVYGTNLATSSTAAQSIPWPDSLGGTQVLINGRAAPLAFAGPAQVSFYVPDGTPTGTATLSVVAPSGTSADLRVNVTSVLPAIFPDSNDPQFGAVVAAGATETTSRRPAGRGNVIEIYCTGLGTSRTGVDGLSRTTLMPAVYINGLAATVLFSGPVKGSPGLYQINARVPVALPPGPQAWPLAVYMGDRRSNEVKVGVE